MSRVGTLASDTIMLSQLLNVQSRLKDLNTQVNTGKKSQDYAGIARDTFSLVALENQRELALRFIQTNTSQQTKMEIMSNSLNTVMQTISTFRSEMGDFLAKGSDDPDALSLIQQLAWTHLQEVQSVMNEKMNGQYIFSGGKTNTKPVELAWGSLTDFQSTYKQASVSATVGSLTFDNATQTITASNVGSLSGFSAGDTITITGTAANNATYTIASIDSTSSVLTLTAAPVNEVIAAGVTIQPQSQFPTTRAGNVALGADYYYKGDNMQIQHRVDENQEFTLGINANDPAIEKAIRAMLLISQGNMTNVETGNAGLIGSVIQLVNDTIQHDAANNSEMESDLLTMQYKIETNVTTVRKAIDRMIIFKATSEARLADLENVNTTEAVTLLTSQQTALEVAYTAFGRVRQLSLSDYI
ncbi:hypothetical protein MTBLM1_30125 [Rhodospirillaceae bacterium LM-1]|nr:hypothetical protein MTBLM1_30125 [Rhodospirillaceae bacterium LM-1]